MTKHGTARNRGLAAELKALRARAELTTRQAAKRVGMSIATLNRIENAIREITPEDVAALLAVYGVTGPERARILVLARNANISGWRETDEGPLPVHLRAQSGLESEAVRVIDVAMFAVPGLLQTADYTRSVLIAIKFPSTTHKAMVEQRAQRQAILSRPVPPNYLALIDESVFRRPTGSRELMAQQYRHLAAMAERPNIDIRIIPFGMHLGVQGSYQQLEFAKTGSIVHVELPQSSMFLDAEHETRAFRDTTNGLLEIAMSSADSVKYLCRLVSESALCETR
ncbi:helix-turn-helix domain-containing protein [Actinokineospora xionganensis]|uniref:Helix-turn-helix domain-containing protein n=1 Tax=Actinokineospora xionganensis TaxID=2684470 RepID=A0ABR7LAR4_9PSEU|nr:helix-turn-helix transcriptional regulator [Actinokineospora xionganensis]MBC6449775.1 helix-turn-helix domain-containing protein [Actinokineospora xionganensis]